MELDTEGSLKRGFYCIVLFLFVVSVGYSVNSSENHPPVFLGNVPAQVIVIAESEVVESSIGEINPAPVGEPEVVMHVRKDSDAKLMVRKQKVEQHKDKLNEKTKGYLESVSDGAEERKYLVKTRKPKNLPESVEVHKKYESIDVLSVSTTPDRISDILEDTDVDLVELDQEISPLGDAIPYGVERVGAPGAWNFTQGDGIAIAVLDTGISAHPDLQIAGGVSVVGGDYADTHGHGTGVAGVISARLNDAGLVGVAPEASIYAVKVMDGASGSLSDAIAGVEWAIENNMSILSMSFGMETYSQIFKEVLEDAYSSGILLVAASGNTGDGEVLYPSAYSSVIAVGAVDESDQKASFSSYGPEVELVATGVNINTTSLNEGYAVGEGTSYAVGFVSGTSALLLAYNNSLTNEQIRAKLQQNALDLGAEGRDPFYGYGLVRVNLTQGEIIIANQSYFYEIYNYTNYGTENESLEFWLNGTGKIDDVSWGIGHYLIFFIYSNLTLNKSVFVDENGTIHLQTLDVLFTNDNFNKDNSTFSDGVAWATSGASITFRPTNKITNDDAYCFNKDGGNYDACRYESGTGVEGNCSAFSATFETSPQTTFYDICTLDLYGGDCSLDSGLNNEHTISGLSTLTSNDIRILTYHDCFGSPSISASSQVAYYSIDMRQSTCVSSSQWKAEGRYDSSPESWHTYRNNTCGTNQECDTARDQNPVSDTTSDINPCRIKSGQGTCYNASDCMTGLQCSNNICTSDGTDIRIMEIIPIQVVPKVDMVLYKSGFVRVWVKNDGGVSANVSVNVTFQGNLLTPYNPSNGFSQVNAQQNKSFDFEFFPNVTGSTILNANAQVIT